MSNKPHKSQLDRWWSLRLTGEDIAHAGLELRESGPEAEARDRLYVANAYATLSTTREIAWWGAMAGLQTGLVVLLIEAVLLAGIALFAWLIYVGSFVVSSEETSLMTTMVSMVRPLLISLPTVPFFGMVGIVTALLRRTGCRHRRVLDKYFSPVAPLIDGVGFWLLVSLLITILVYAGGLADSGSNVTGLLFLTFMAGGALSWPAFAVWRQRYLQLIRRHGSASMDEILQRIRRQC